MSSELFVDPRNDPSPTATKPRTTAQPDELAGLHRLCRTGRLYEVERWIRSGKPLQADKGAVLRGRRESTALEIALDCGNRSLVFLLLCNGYDPNLDRSCPLDLAMRNRQWDLVDLLLEWGADPFRVELSELFGTYRSELWERFLAFGVDLAAGHAMGDALWNHSSNKPLFGFAKRHLGDHPEFQTELNMALAEHAREGNEKGVMLSLWAGADPHVPAPSFRHPETFEDQEDLPEEDRFYGFSAVHEACSTGHVRILERLGPDPARDDFERLYRVADSVGVVEVLARRALPKHVGKIVRWQLMWLEDRLISRPGALDIVRTLFDAGARWEKSPDEEIICVRRSLLKLSEYKFIETMKLLTTGDYCSPAILKELGRTPKMRERMRKVGFIPSSGDRYSCRHVRPRLARQVRGKVGIPEEKRRRYIPHVVVVGRWDPQARQIRLDRAGLFDRVWSQPVDRLAKEWGLSGRGLAKLCQRLEIPVPPRGFWAKAYSGGRVRRPRLPSLRPGGAEEIVIRVAACGGSFRGRRVSTIAALAGFDLKERCLARTRGSRELS